MTPSSFYAFNGFARMCYANSTGGLSVGLNVTKLYGVRAVINLRSDVLISQGEGTIENPYFLLINGQF